MSIYLDELRAAYPDTAEPIDMLPPYMHDGVALWITRGIEPGSFLSAVINNNLRGAVMRADDFNRDMLREWVGFFYNYAPSQCWGSQDKAREWMRIGGLLGLSRSKPGDDVDNIPEDAA